MFTKIIFTILLALMSISTRCQVARSNFDSTDTGQIDSNATMPVFDLSRIDSLSQLQSSVPVEKLRADRYSIGGPHPFPLYTHSTGKTVVPDLSTRYVGRAALPAKVSDFIVVGTVQSADVHISSDRSMVYSTFVFNPSKILKGTIHGKHSKILLERIGGFALYPDGKKRFIGERDTGIPEPDHKYLLFLKAFPTSGSYQIIGGFYLNGGSPVALDTVADRSNYKDSSSLFEALQKVISAQ